MHNRLLYLSGFKLVILACTTLLNGCAIQDNNNPTNDTRTPIATKAAQQRPTIPLACSAVLVRPAKFTTRRESYTVLEATPVYENTPAVIDWATTRLQLEPARFTHETLPAQYREVKEKVVVSRERDELQGIPSVYKTRDKPVTIVPAHTRWKEGCIPKQNPVACFENVPAKTRILKQSVVDIPGKIVQKRLPAETTEITRKVLVKAGRGIGPIIPARYIDVKIARVSKVWKIATIYTAPRYEKLKVQVKSQKDQIKKFPVMCRDAEAKYIKQLQQNLKTRGFPIKLSGTFDPATLKAVIKFQHDNNLFTGAVSPETLEKLGLR